MARLAWGTMLASLAMLVCPAWGARSGSCKNWKMVGSTPLNASFIDKRANEGLSCTGMKGKIQLSGRYTWGTWEFRERTNPPPWASPHLLVNHYSLPNPIPQDYSIRLLLDHLGDFDGPYKGVYVVPVETLNYKGACMFFFPENPSGAEGVPMVLRSRQKHMPWVAIDRKLDLLYSSEFDNVSSLNVYKFPDLTGLEGQGSDLELIATYDLGTTLQGVQGGVFDEFGTLFITQNPPRPSIVSVDIAGGSHVVTPIASPIQPEMEGITFCDWSGYVPGTLHVMNGHDTNDFDAYSSLFHFECQD